MKYKILILIILLTSCSAHTTRLENRSPYISKGFAYIYNEYDYENKIIKAIKIRDEKDIDNYKEYINADIILFDTPGMEKSIEFPKSLISKLPKGERYALAGSISQSNIENIKKLGITFCDLSSNLETDAEIGYKDHQKIKKFIKKVNELKN